MKKKLVSILLCMTMVASMVVGCGSSNSGESNNDAEENVQETTDDTTGGDSEVTERTVYVTAQWLKDAMDGKVAGYEDVKVLFVGYDEQSVYEEGHIPGAIYVDNQEVEDAVGDVEQPYNLLSAEEVTANLLSHGITKDTKVVLYGGDVSGTARQAYGYIWDGVEDVKILNGGLDAWTAAGFDASETTVNEGEAAEDFGTEVPAHPEYWVSMDEAKDRVANEENFKLVSIRSEEEWLGTTSGYSYMDKAGEPEGAVWGKGPLNPYDMSGYQNEDGTIQTLAQVQAGTWSDVDFTLDNHLSFYCGTGWRACIPFLICYQEGYDNISVYDGGWYEWMLHDENPVQVGDPNSDDCLHTTVGELPNDKAAK